MIGSQIFPTKNLMDRLLRPYSLSAVHVLDHTPHTLDLTH